MHRVDAAGVATEPPKTETPLVLRRLSLPSVRECDAASSDATRQDELCTWRWGASHEPYFWPQAALLLLQPARACLCHEAWAVMERRRAG